MYLNRELSLLAFNRRVLEQSRDTDVPLLERLRFLTIVGNNLDEFFEIRVSGVKQRLALGLGTNAPDAIPPGPLLQAIRASVDELLREQYRILNEELLPALHDRGVCLKRRSLWSDAQRKWVKHYFRDQVLPVLTPVGLDPTHPFPELSNKSLSFVASVTGEDAFGRASGLAVVPIPRSLPRVLRIPEGDLVLISSVVHAHIAELFPGMNITGCWQFRVTRDSDLWIDEEEAEDLLSAIKGELHGRPYGAPVRLEVDRNIRRKVARALLARLDLQETDLYEVDGPVNLHRLNALHDLVDRPELKYPPFVPGFPAGVTPKTDFFELLRRQDVLLHHPYQSFQPVVELIRQAVNDPEVLAIKQTLYRSGTDSPIAEALLEAARAGKAVTVVIELRARFDEAANIHKAQRLRAAGATVVYGVVGHKCHAKMLLILRREGKRIRRYAHLSTGNYHPGTARAYTDIGFMTADRDISRDMQALFNELTGLGAVAPMAALLHAPFTLLKGLLKLIAAEAAAARAGRPAHIRAKLNSLSEPRVIAALYDASRAGVKIELVVRGICRLRPGIPGMSENIHVRSIIGRFLEHSRVFCFHAGGEDIVICGSADWMERNLRRRVEACWPLTEPEARARVISESFDVHLDPASPAWVLQSDGTWDHHIPEGPTLEGQVALLQKLAPS